MTNIPTISTDQAHLLATWLQANAKAPGWLDGYPLGGSYIDTRASKGANRDGRKAYVKIDHDTADKVPEFRGKSAFDVREFLTREFPEMVGLSR